MTGKLLTEEELKELRAYRITDGLDEEVWGHITALTEKLRESEAGAAALRESLENALSIETNPWTATRTDGLSLEIFGEWRKRLSSVSAGRDLLERLRLAEKELVGRRESEDAQTKAHLAVIQRAEESEARAAALREALEDAEEHLSALSTTHWHHWSMSWQTAHNKACASVDDALSSTAGRDLLERMRKAEAEVKSKTEAAEYFRKCANDTAEEREDAIRRAEDAEARVKELKTELKEEERYGVALRDALLGKHNAEGDVRLYRSALEKCVEALGVATTPLARDRLTVLDALRAARDAGVGT